MLNEHQRRALREKKERELELRRIVDSGVCPCGSKLVVNLAIIGWHHCERLYKDCPQSFQIFTTYKWGKS